MAMPWSSVVLSWTRLSTVSLTVTLERAPPVVALFTWTLACTGKSEKAIIIQACLAPICAAINTSDFLQKLISDTMIPSSQMDVVINKS